MQVDEERRRRKNAKRLLWLMLAAALLVLGIVAYTSIDAPPPGPLVSDRSTVATDRPR